MIKISPLRLLLVGLVIAVQGLAGEQRKMSAEDYLKEIKSIVGNTTSFVAKNCSIDINIGDSKNFQSIIKITENKSDESKDVVQVNIPHITQGIYVKEQFEEGLYHQFLYKQSGVNYEIILFKDRAKPRIGLSIEAKLGDSVKYGYCMAELAN